MTVTKTSEAPLRIGLFCSQAMYGRCITPQAAAALSELGEWTFHSFEEPSSWTAPPPWNAASEARACSSVANLDLVIIGPGAPRITDTIMDSAPRLRMIAELEGDRFGHRIDLAAAEQRRIRVVDTSQGSSYPVAEWALALMLIGLRNAGALFRDLIDGVVIDQSMNRAQIGYVTGELTGKTVGLVGCGYIGRHLVRLLAPFHCRILACDPGLSSSTRDALGIDTADLPTLMSRSDVVVCSLPLTDDTRGMIGETALAALPDHAVFVNVGRGPVVDSDALLARLEMGGVTACLDVFDPEPIPADSPVRAMRNVFLSPHIAGVTADCGPRFVLEAVEDARRYFSGINSRYDLYPRR